MSSPRSNVSLRTRKWRKPIVDMTSRRPFLLLSSGERAGVSGHQSWAAAKWVNDLRLWLPYFWRALLVRPGIAHDTQVGSPHSRAMLYESLSKNYLLMLSLLVVFIALAR